MLENPTDSSSTTNIATFKRYAPPNQRNRSLGRRKSGGDSPRLISLQGCGSSEAYQLLNNRWTAAMNAYQNPSTDLVERPVMYSGINASSWGQIRLPHQMVSSTEFQIDFMSELSKQCLTQMHGSEN